MKKVDLRVLLCAIVMAGCLSMQPVRAEDTVDTDDDTPPAWNGLYLGVHGGEMFSDITNGQVAGPSGHTDSLMAGAQIGYNWQRNQLVFGLEGDISAFDVSVRSSLIGYEEDWMTTFRARLGYSLGRFMPYATAGFAMTDTVIKTTNNHNTNLAAGLAAGLGVDMMILGPWIARFEYLHTEVPRDRSTVGTSDVEAGSMNDTIRIGISYKF